MSPPSLLSLHWLILVLFVFFSVTGKNKDCKSVVPGSTDDPHVFNPRASMLMSPFAVHICLVVSHY